MLALAYSLGFRKGELLSLKVGDVDLMEGILRLRDSKNGEPRQVSLTAETRGLLAACIDGKSADAAVFTRGSGNAVQDFRGTWAAATKAAGCARLLFHSLRRSAVRNLIFAGPSDQLAPGFEIWRRGLQLLRGPAHPQRRPTRIGLPFPTRTARPRCGT